MIEVPALLPANPLGGIQQAMQIRASQQEQAMRQQAMQQQSMQMEQQQMQMDEIRHVYVPLGYVMYVAV